MTIQSTVRKAGPYACNGVTVAFPFSFKVFTAADLVVTRTDLTPLDTILALTADYTVALNADQNALPGGTVTLTAAPATGFLVTVTSGIAATQAVSLQNLGGFNPSIINDEFDKLTILYQQLVTQVSGALTVPVGSGQTATQYLASLIAAQYTQVYPQPLAIVANGAFKVWQRGTSFASGAAQYSADRWQFFRTGATVGGTLSRQATGLSGFQYCARAQRNAADASTQFVVLAQSFESVDVIPLQGQTLTLQFRARCGANFSAASSQLSVQVTTGTGTDGNISAGFTGSSAVVNTAVTLTTSWQTFTISVPTLAGVTQLGVTLQFVPVGTAGAADYFEATGVQLMPVTTPAVVQFATFADELRRCQRYYWKTFPYATAPAQNVGGSGLLLFDQISAGATGNTLTSTLLPTQMRPGGVGTIYNPSAANSQVRNSTRSLDNSASSVTVSESSVYIGFVGCTGSQVNDINFAHLTIESEL